MSIYETAKLSASPAPLGCVKVITVRQPWATLLMLGIKKFETRSWSTKFRGMVMLHVSKAIPRAEDWGFFAWPNHNPDWVESFNTAYKKHTLGTVIGAMNIEDSLRTEKLLPSSEEQSMGDWTPGRYAWRMIPWFELETPIEAKGALGLWNWRAPKGIHPVTGMIPYSDGKNFFKAVGWEAPHLTEGGEA